MDIVNPVVNEEAKRIQTANTAWNDVVREILAKAKKVELADVVPPPESYGRYITYAVNAQGFYCMPKQRGRKHPHWSPARNAHKSLMMDTFKREFNEAANVEEVDAIIENRDSDGVGKQQTIELYIRAAQSAQNHFVKRAQERRRATRQRQVASRAVNAGYRVANQDRRAVAAPSATWTETRAITQRRYHVLKPKAAPAPPAVAPGTQAAA